MGDPDKTTTTQVLRVHFLPGISLFSIMVLFLLASGMAIAESTWAAEQWGVPLYTEQEFTSGIPSVMSATRLSQSPYDAPASITIIDREMIEASGLLEIPDLLRLAPGFQVAYATGGSRFSVNYHGNGDAWSRRIQVLVDGRPVIVPVLSNVDWDNIGVALEDIDRIEVIRGPNAVAYGANAFSAAINIITRQPFQDRGMMVTTTTGSLDTRNVTSRYAAAIKNFDYRVTLGYRTDEGFSAVDDYKRVRMASFRAGYTPTYADSFELHLNYSGGEFGSWGEDTDVYNPVREQMIDDGAAMLRWQRIVSASEAFHLQLYTNYYDKREGFNVGPLSSLLGIDPSLIPLLFDGHEDQSFYVSPLSAKAERHDLEFQHTYLPVKLWRLSWGGNLRLDRVKSAFLFGHDDFIDDHSATLFGNAEWHTTPSMVLNVGLMAEHHEATGTHASSRIGLNYHLSPHQNLRISTSNTIRAPSAFENFAYRAVEFSDGSTLLVTGDGPGDLNPERIRAYEIGYIGEFPRQGLALDLKVYREVGEELITDTYDRDYQQPYPMLNDFQSVHVGQNGCEITTDGFEAQLSYRPTIADRLSLQYGYIDMQGTQLDSINPDSYEDLGNYAPRHTASALISHQLDPQVQMSLVYYSMSGFQWAGLGTELDSYQRLDARLALGLGPEGRNGKLEFIVHNLLDDSYREFVPENIYERRGYMRLSVNL